MPGAFGKFDWMLMSRVRIQVSRAARERSTPAVAHGIKATVNSWEEFAPRHAIS